MFKYTFILVLLATGCYAQNRHVQQQLHNVQSLGSFDLTCAPSDLQVVILDYYNNGPHPTVVGVFGCGQRVSYRRNINKDSTGGWKRVTP